MIVAPEVAAPAGMVNDNFERGLDAKLVEAMVVLRLTQAVVLELKAEGEELTVTSEKERDPVMPSPLRLIPEILNEVFQVPAKLN